jgi:hypothetical protein
MYQNLIYSSNIITEFQCFLNLGFLVRTRGIVMTAQLFQAKSFLRVISRLILLLSFTNIVEVFVWIFGYLHRFAGSFWQPSSLKLRPLYEVFVEYSFFLSCTNRILLPSNFRTSTPDLQGSSYKLSEHFTRCVLEAYLFFTCTNRLPLYFKFKVLHDSPTLSSWVLFTRYVSNNTSSKWCWLSSILFWISCYVPETCGRAWFHTRRFLGGMFSNTCYSSLLQTDHHSILIIRDLYTGLWGYLQPIF